MTAVHTPSLHALAECQGNQCRLSHVQFAYTQWVLRPLQGLRAQMAGYWARVHELRERLAHKHGADAAHTQRGAQDAAGRNVCHQVTLCAGQHLDLGVCTTNWQPAAGCRAPLVMSLDTVCCKVTATMAAGGVTYLLSVTGHGSGRKLIWFCISEVLCCYSLWAPTWQKKLQGMRCNIFIFAPGRKQHLTLRRMKGSKHLLSVSLAPSLAWQRHRLILHVMQRSAAAAALTAKHSCM